MLPIGDVEKVIDLADSITRLPCGCRFLSTGKSNARYCFGIGVSKWGGFKAVPDASSSLELLDKEVAKRIIRDCMAYKTYIEQRGVPTFFRAEYICRVDPDLCNGCKQCIQQCQFGAQFYSSLLARPPGCG